jgi:hypothetical protein
MGRILTATPLDGKEKGLIVHNEDHSTTLSDGRVHGHGYDMEIFQPSQLPRVGNESHVLRLLVSGTGSTCDSDKFQMDAAYHDKLRQEQALVCSSMPLVRSVAVVSRPGELLDQERCEVMRILAQIVNSM